MPIMVAIDNKPIYDHVHRERVTVKDKRFAIDMLLVRDDIKNQSITVRCIDTKQMLSDTLTKLHATPDLNRSVFKSGRCILVEQKEVLRLKEQERVNRQANRPIPSTAKPSDS